MAELEREAAAGRFAGRALLQRHTVELALQRLRRRLNRPVSGAERQIALLAGEALAVHGALSAPGRARLVALLRAAMTEDRTLIPAFHLLRTAAMQRARGFGVFFAELEDGAPYDLLLTRDGIEAELACDVISAEEGRSVHRGAWFRLADRVDPHLQTWLASHPGRYLLKMTLPDGLRGSLRPARGEEADGSMLSGLHDRIRTMLESRKRDDQDPAVVLRLDPLMLAAAQADELGLMNKLRREFGPEANLAVTAAGGGIFIMAARAGRENEIAVAIRRRLAAVAPVRLTGSRPGILSVFVEDTDRQEWRGLRERLELEGEARQFFTNPEARAVVCATFASRMEMFGCPEPDGAAGGELRYRNPAHPAARTAALAPAVLSSV